MFVFNVTLSHIYAYYFQDKIKDPETDTSDCTDNYVQSLVDSLLCALAKATRNSNANIGFTPKSVVEIPFSRDAFWRIFKDVIPKNVSKMSDSVKLSVSVKDMNSMLCTEVNKYVKPNSCTQVRIFGFYDLHFYEYNCTNATNAEALRYFCIDVVHRGD